MLWRQCAGEIIRDQATLEIECELWPARCSAFCENLHHAIERVRSINRARLRTGQDLDTLDTFGVDLRKEFWISELDTVDIRLDGIRSVKCTGTAGRERSRSS